MLFSARLSKSEQQSDSRMRDGEVGEEADINGEGISSLGWSLRGKAQTDTDGEKFSIFQTNCKRLILPKHK